MEPKTKFKGNLTFIISIIAFLISGYTFISGNFLNQHVLKSSVVSIEPTDDSISCYILLSNNGKSYETLYAAHFIFSDDLNKGGGSLSKEKIGPTVIAPSQAVVFKLTTRMPNIKDLKSEGIIPENSDKIHMGVLFDVIDKKGNLTEDGKIFKFAQLQFDSNGQHISTSPRKDDNNGMLDLL